MQMYKHVLLVIVLIGLLIGCQTPPTTGEKGSNRSSEPRVEQSATNLLLRTVKRDLDQHTTTSNYHIMPTIDLNQVVFNDDSSLRTTFDALNESIIDILLIRDRDNALLDAEIEINSGGIVYDHSIFLSEDTSLIIKLHGTEDYLTIPANEETDNTAFRRVAIDFKDVFYTALTKDWIASKWTMAHDQTIQTINDETLKLSIITASLTQKDVFKVIDNMIKAYTEDADFMIAIRDNIIRHARVDGKNLTESEIDQEINRNIELIYDRINFIESILDIDQFNITIGVDDKELIIYENYTIDATYNGTHTINTVNAKDKTKDIEFSLNITAQHSDFGKPYTPKKVVLTDYNSQTLESLVMSILFSD